MSAVYRFDYFLETRKFPLVPYGKVGLDWGYWQITDGNDEIATDGQNGRGRGGTLGWHAAAGLAFVLDFVRSGGGARSSTRTWASTTRRWCSSSRAPTSPGSGQSDRMHLGDTNWSLGLMFQF